MLVEARSSRLLSSQLTTSPGADIQQTHQSPEVPDSLEVAGVGIQQSSCDVTDLLEVAGAEIQQFYRCSESQLSESVGADILCHSCSEVAQERAALEARFRTMSEHEKVVEIFLEMKYGRIT